MKIQEQKNGFYRRYGKRFFDIVLSLPALIVLAPFMAELALVVRVSHGAPVLFRQRRPGRSHKPFTLYKLRTMIKARDGQDPCSSDAERLTPVGRTLRRLSLDELPEILNVLRGDMSLVGPRPLMMQYVGRYTPEQARRHDVRPGITGWAQVNGRNALTWEERFKLDVWYVDHQSLRLDLMIIGLTVLKIAKREGISLPGHATMPEFMGTDTSS